MNISASLVSMLDRGSQPAVFVSLEKYAEKLVSFSVHTSGSPGPGTHYPICFELPKLHWTTANL